MGNLVIQIPDDIHKNARLAALQQGKTLKAFVTEAIERAIEEHQAAEEKRRKRR